MDINIDFKGLVPANLETVSLNLKTDYVPQKGKNIGKSQGPVIFIGKGTPTKRATYSNVQDALLDVIDDAPDGTKVYANGTYMPIAKAAELDLEGFLYKAAGRIEPYWNSLAFWTPEAVTKKNAGAKPKAATKKAKTGNLPKM